MKTVLDIAPAPRRPPWRGSPLAGRLAARTIFSVAGLAALLTGGAVWASTTGPAIYQGRALVTAASPSCLASVGDSFGATLRLPATMPHQFKIALLGDQEALRLARTAPNAAALVALDDLATVASETVALAAGSTVTMLGDGAAEASATFTGKAGFLGTGTCTITLFFALSSPPA